MTAHHPNLTRIAADAIVAQVSSRADCEGGNFCGEVGDTECEFQCWFSTDWSGPCSDDYGYKYFEAKCTLLGAHGHDPQTGAEYAGNRAEIEALVGGDTVYGWERAQGEVEMGQ
jgi:hypothetical protein